MRRSTLYKTLLLLAALAAIALSSFGQAHYDSARVYVGTYELTENSGPHVERFLASVGLPAGNPYCASFVSHTLDVAVPSPVYPTVRSGLATNFLKGEHFTITEVLEGAYQPARGDLLVWRRGNGIFGHIETIDWWDGKCGQTIGANVSNPFHNGREGVYFKNRCAQPLSEFRIVAVVPVRYTRKIRI